MLSNEQRKKLETAIGAKAINYRAVKVMGMIKRDIKKWFLKTEDPKIRWYQVSRHSFNTVEIFVRGWTLSQRDQESINEWYKTPQGAEDFRKYGVDREVWP